MANDAAGGAPQAKSGGGLMGMPLWVWGAGVGLVIVFLWYKHSHPAAAASTDTGQPLVPGVVTDPNTGFPIDPLTGLPYVTSQGAGSSTNTLGGWITSAEAFLKNAGYNPALTEQSLYDFTNGNHLSNREVGVIQRALQGIGHPPDLLPILGTIPTPPAPPKAMPKKPATAAAKGKAWWFSAATWKWVQRAIPTKPKAAPKKGFSWVYDPSTWTWLQKATKPIAKANPITVGHLSVAPSKAA